MKCSDAHRGVAAKIIVLCGLALAASAASAGEALDRCNRYDPPDADRIVCYFDEMESIRSDRDYIATLRAVAIDIRGTERKGTEREFDCGWGVGRGVERGIQKVRFEVSGGKCSRQWNDWVASKARYLELYCELRYGVPDIGDGHGDDEVDRNRANADKYLRDYDACFTENIPEEHRVYPVKDRASFVQYMNDKTREFEEAGSAQEFDDLARACNDRLGWLAQSDPGIVRDRNLRCK